MFSSIYKQRHSRCGYKLGFAGLALLVVLVLFAASCGNSSSDSDNSADSDSSADSSAQNASDSETSANQDTSNASASQDTQTGQDTRQPDTGEPVYGGTLVMGLEAETGQGWNPATTQCAISCHTVMRAIFDPLFIEDANGVAQPYLLESATPSQDFTEWTLTIRQNIQFHDGTPANAVALRRHIIELKGGILTGQFLSFLDDPEESVQILDTNSVLLRLNTSTALLPSVFTGQLSYLPSPSQYDDEDGARFPVGTGPFRFDSWTLDSELRVSRNDNYWRQDNQGRQLPYLDSVIFRPIPDTSTRQNALDSQDLHLYHENSPENAIDNRENHEVVEEQSFRQTSYVLANNEKAPFDNLSARLALAMCTDRDLYLALRAGDNTEVANGPFSPGTPGWLAETGYPDYDREAGRALWEQLDNPGTISIQTSNDPFNLTSSEALVSMWEQCGIDAEISQLTQGQLISTAVAGNFQLLLWRNHNGASLEAERLWWHSDSAVGLAVNFGRIRNDAVDQALDDARRTSDPQELREAAERVNRAFAEQVNNIWLIWSLWQIPHSSNVKNVDYLEIPDAGPALSAFEGRIFLTETWLEE